MITTFKQTPSQRSGGFAHAGLLLALVVVAVATFGAFYTLRSHADTVDDQQKVGTTRQYVAIGDSYSAGPEMGTTIDVGCARSNANYPHRIKNKSTSAVILRDNTCSGATTLSTTTAQRLSNGTSNQPQFEGLSKTTDLVTIGIGANDYQFYSSHVVGCGKYRDSDPTGAPCKAALGDPSADLVKIQTNIGMVLREVKQRAPAAKIIVIGYPDIIPASGTCDELPLADGDYAYVRSALQGLVSAQKRAATSHNATFIDMQPASAGHDICSSSPWIAGKTKVPGTAAAYHPYPAEQQAVALAVLGVLSNSK